MSHRDAMALGEGVSMNTKQMEGHRMIWNGESNHGKEMRSKDKSKKKMSRGES